MAGNSCTGDVAKGKGRVMLSTAPVGVSLEDAGGPDVETSIGGHKAGRVLGTPGRHHSMF